MTKTQSVTIMLTIPKQYRDLLRKLAAQENLRDPDKVVTGSHLAKEFLVGALDAFTQQNKSESREEAGT